MKPVAIFRHAATEGPGYLAEFLDEHHIPWRLIAIDRHEAVPQSASAYSGLVFMGGPMSVNDDLLWISQVLELIRDAVDKKIPVLGHCLGGQLISKALGGTVSKNSVKEIGWGKVEISDNETARAWFGDVKIFDAFHWHGETFTLPDKAVHILSGEHCVNQGYAIGPHLALQCHIEMTPSLISSWCDVGTDEIAASRTSPAVQRSDEIQQQMAGKLPRLHEVASRLYTKWIHGLNPAS